MHGYARSCPSPGLRITAATLGAVAVAGDATAVPDLPGQPARHPLPYLADRAQWAGVADWRQLSGRCWPAVR